KLLHTSDWHLGAMEGDRRLLDDQKFFLDKICDIASEQAVDAVIIAGDVFDRAVASGEAIRLYDDAMTRLCAECGLTVILIAGNHDSAERLSSCRDLLSRAGLHIAGALERDVPRVSFADADIYLLPWITEEKVKSIFPEKREEIRSLDDAYRVVTGHIRETMDTEKKNIIVSHAFITDSETSVSDRAAVIGFASQVSAGVFNGFDYAALGHIHKPQDVSDTVRYSGTPMQYSFGVEEKQEKSVTIFDTGTMTKTVIPLPLLHRRTTIAGTLAEVLDGEYPDEVKNGYVRVRITDQYAGLEVLSELKRIFPNLLEVSGKTFESENPTVTLTVDELEKFEADPVEVFRHFCREETDTEPDAYMTELFEMAIAAAEKTED
ncbi:MAG: exonuclease SbcCD subunit D, partial [Clostridia bacterium]|nr:exonuclease SbcCD subunit D [Clostridia bacterium]